MMLDAKGPSKYNKITRLDTQRSIYLIMEWKLSWGWAEMEQQEGKGPVSAL